MTTDPDPNPDQIDDRVERSDEAAYDFTARVLGRGTASQGGAYILPYLQSGHMLLLGVLLLASSISYPGDHMPTYMHAYCGAVTLRCECSGLSLARPSPNPNLPVQRPGRLPPSRKSPSLRALTWQASP